MLSLYDVIVGATADPEGFVESAGPGTTGFANLPILQKPVAGGVIDSREAYPGSMFVALRGEKADGHDYVGQAFQRGASMALVHQELAGQFQVIDLAAPPEQVLFRLSQLDPEAPFALKAPDSLAALQAIASYWRRKLQLRVVGITGSVGKSTTKELIASVLSQRYRTVKNLGNLNNEIGLPLTMLSANKNHERMVLEMGFYVPGEIKFLCELALPHVGVITNIGTVHASRAGSQEAIARGKAELVESLPPAPEGVAILNYDDPLVRRMAEKTRARVIFYGLDPAAEIWADSIEGLGLDGIQFRLHHRSEVVHLRIPLIGRHSVHTALRAAAVGLLEGLTWQEIVNGLRSERAQLRLVAVRSANGALLLDDTYNASPESSLAALNLLEELEGRKIAVLGDMLELGIYEREGHELVGARAAEVVDELVTVGERARVISNSAWQAGLSKKAISVFSDNQQVIAYLQERLNENDVVLVKGSHSMHMEQIVAALEGSRRGHS